MSALSGHPAMWRSVWRIIKLGLIVGVPMILIYLAVGEGPAAALIDAAPLGVAITSTALLIADIVIPVPSTVVIVFAGNTLGWWAGIAVGTAGLSVGCIVGYLIGRLLPKRAIAMIEGDDGSFVQSALSRSAVTWLVVLRPVPILGEISAIVAGVLRLNFPTFAVATTLSNLALSTAYVTLGSAAHDWLGFVLAILASWSLPAAAMLAVRLLRSKRAGGLPAEAVAEGAEPPAPPSRQEQ